MRPRPGAAAVAASGQWTDPGGVRQPAGEVHAWLPGTNQTVCGLALSRSALRRFPHIRWDYRPSDVLTAADQVGHVCARCAAAMAPRRGDRRPWTRHAPRP